MRDDKCDINGLCKDITDITTNADINDENNQSQIRQHIVLKDWRIPFLTGYNY